MKVEHAPTHGMTIGNSTSLQGFPVCTLQPEPDTRHVGSPKIPPVARPAGRPGPAIIPVPTGPVPSSPSPALHRPSQGGPEDWSDGQKALSALR